jgi:hypothetical protein
MKIALLTIAVMVVSASVLAHSQRISSGSSGEMKANAGNPALSDSASLRGKQLRAAIDQYYKEHGVRNAGVQITDLVVKYIPVGTSFDQAEVILTAGGFTVGPRVPHQNLPPSDPSKFTVVARIDHYGPWSICGTDVDVYLQPRVPNDYSTVQKITAWIARTCP